ncbi:MAG: methyltransferase [Candidatus Diapherotrites archaeon]
MAGESNEMLTVDYNGITVYYKKHLDGGGSTFGQDYIPEVGKRFGKVGRVHEFCCGPAFIGFSLLAHGLCDSLCLSDINPKAIEMCRLTVKENRLEGVVDCYVSDCLKGIPETEKWDLVVSNPPHFDGTEEDYAREIRSYDPKWRIHKEFYENIGGFLNEGASVYFYENGRQSNPEIFKEMAGKAGLEFAGIRRPGKLEVIPRCLAWRLPRVLHKFPNIRKMAGIVIRSANYPFYFIHSRKPAAGSASNPSHFARGRKY